MFLFTSLNLGILGCDISRVERNDYEYVGAFFGSKESPLQCRQSIINVDDCLQHHHENMHTRDLVQEHVTYRVFPLKDGWTMPKLEDEYDIKKKIANQKLIMMS